MSSFEIYGFDAFEKTLFNMIEVKFPQEVEKVILQIAERLYDKAVARTPVGDGYHYRNWRGKRRRRKKPKSKVLKNRWKIGKVRRKRGEWYIEVKNSAPHAHLIEDGHKIKNRKDGPVLGFVPGQKMLQISVKEIEAELPGHLRGWLDRMMRELEL